MMNKKIWTGILVILLVFGIVVISCGDDDNGTADIVSINYQRAPQVSSVTVTKTTNNMYYIVSWDAVEGDVYNYQVFFKQDGKNSSSSIGSGQNFFKYDPAAGDQIANDDLDKWSYRVSSLNAPTAGSYCFGVRTVLNNTTVSSTGSDIKWAAGITVTALPQISAVSAKKTTDGNYLLASWDAVAGAGAYKVVVYYRTKNSTESLSSSSGSGQNTYTYAEADGNPSANTNTSKWSYMSSYNSNYEYQVVVTPVSGDISVIGIATTSPIIR